MSMTLRALAALSLGICCYGGASAEERYFNSYMLRAYEHLRNNHAAKYNSAYYFTQNLDYGSAKGAIKASNPPYTMCNAAVAETIIDAINLYADDHVSWSPQALIPASSWTTPRWSQLLPHIFSHDYTGYDPLDAVVKAHIPIERGLQVDIKNFQSEHGMSIALEKFGLGESIPFERARPGDVISFDRDLSGGGVKPGHSAIFLSFLTHDQKDISTYKAGQIVGFKYFSIQSSEPSGLGERWAYFKVPDNKANTIEMCPYSDDKKMPSDPRRSYCPDAIDTEANRTRFPALKPGQPRDCCVVRYGTDAPRVGRLLSPPFWKYSQKQQQVAHEENALRDHVEEFMENLTRAGERLRLYAIGAVSLEKTNRPAASEYIQRVKREFDIDLHAVADADTPPEIGQQKLHKISLITPATVIRLANEQVTAKLRAEINDRVRAKAIAQTDSLRTRIDSVPNPRFDGKSTD